MVSASQKKFLEKFVNAEFCANLTQICQPLNIFNITCFVYVKSYKNGNLVTLSNRGDWLAHFFQANYINPTVFETKVKSGRYLDLTELKVPAIQVNTARESFNADYWLNIVETSDEFYEVYAFATARKNYSILNFYLNNMDVLEHFICYFKDKSSDLIAEACGNPILPVRENIIFSDKCIDILSSDKLRDIFFSQTKLDKHYLRGKTNYITSREYQCISLLAKGKQVKEIANSLELSPKTVKAYIINAKNRLGCYSKSQLIEIFNDAKQIKSAARVSKRSR